MTRRTFCAAAGLAPLAAQPPPRKRPNVILVMTDDQGYGDLACHGNPVLRTPNLDRLHSESVRLTNFHADPLCSPTRSALMTGRYSCRAGVWATVMGRSLLRREEVTMADVFAANGYHTGIFGKWHLGDNYPFRPQDRGFQESLVHGGGGVGQTPDSWGNTYFNDTYLRYGKPEQFQGYCTDVWFDNALRFIESNRQRPFFLYLATNAPHSPFRVDERYSRPYRDRGLPPQIAAFYGMITNLDDNAGRLRRRLSELGLENDTLLVFLTDNGSGGGMLEGRFNAGMRAAKGTPYEGGHRVPCFLRWPNGGLGGGRDISRLACHFDLLPTLVELLGLGRPGGPPWDGASLAPLLAGKGDLPERTLVVQTQQRDHPVKWQSSAVMTQRWRLVNGRELYDLRSDPGQTSDVAAANGAAVEQLRASYEKWWADVSARFGEYTPIVIGDQRDNPCRITCHDWHADTPQGVPWNQDMIRRAPVANGFWAVEVARAGQYEFRLRRYPLEEDAALGAVTARVKAGEAEASVSVRPEAPEARVVLSLPAGPARLQTWLSDREGVGRGAYFVYVVGPA